jgi:hypothetical protein
MNGSILIYVGSFLTFTWGFAHLFPTGSVVRGFGAMSADNKRIITMEWIIEGVALIFIGFVNALVTYVDHSSVVAMAVYWASFGALNILSLVSLFTGFRNTFLPFKLCPLIFTGSSLLIVIGAHVG